MPQFNGVEVLDLAACKARCLRECDSVNDPHCHPSDDDWRPCPLCDHDTPDNLLSLPECP